MLLKGRADVERFLRAPGEDFLSALIHGRDQGIVRERARSLATSVTERPDDPFDVAVVTEADLESDPSHLVDELCAISMMGGRRLIRLTLGEDRGAARIATEALVEHVARRCNPEAFFIIEAPALAKDSPLRNVGEKAAACAVIACYEDEPADVRHLVRQALARDGLGLSSEALEVFISRLPHDRGIVRAEIERLVLFLGPTSGRTATAADLASFLGVEPDATLAGAAEDAFGGRSLAAQAGLRRAALEMEAGASAVRAMGAYLARLRRVLTMREKGAELQSAARSAGIFWKNEREFLRQARAWNLGALDSLQADVLASDRGCKRAGAPAELISERLALSIAARAQRLGL